MTWPEFFYRVLRAIQHDPWMFLGLLGAVCVLLTIPLSYLGRRK